MASYAIMRCKKLNSMGTVAAALQHCYRERETPNADSERTPDNEHLAAKSTDEAMGQLRERLPEKRRKDAVLAVEYVMTASPEWWKYASQEEQAAFFDQAHKWLADKYGADNIITATIHRDETSPHLSAFVVPLTKDGRLSAKEFIGNRSKMSADQTSFAEAVENLGLKRGIERSRAQHQTIKSYYAAIQQEPAHVTITPTALEPRPLKPQGIAEKLGLIKRVESPDDIAARLTDEVRRVYSPAVKAAAGARQERQTAKQAQETARHLRERLQPVLEALAPLNRDMQAKAIAVIKAAAQKLLAEQREAVRQRQQARGRGRGRREQERQASLLRRRSRGRGGGLSR